MSCLWIPFWLFIDLSIYLYRQLKSLTIICGICKYIRKLIFLCFIFRRRFGRTKIPLNFKNVQLLLIYFARSMILWVPKKGVLFSVYLSFIWTLFILSTFLIRLYKNISYINYNMKKPVKKLPQRRIQKSIKQTSNMEIFREKSQRLRAVNYFRKKAPYLVLN